MFLRVGIEAQLKNVLGRTQMHLEHQGVPFDEPCAPRDAISGSTSPPPKSTFTDDLYVPMQTLVSLARMLPSFVMGIPRRILRSKETVEEKTCLRMAMCTYRTSSKNLPSTNVD